MSGGANPAMREPASGSVTPLATIAVALRDRIVNHGFVAFELLVAWLCRAPRQRILFSEVTKERATIERSFRLTPHEIHFGDFRPEMLSNFDLLVPLLYVGSVRRLDELRPFIGHSRLPIPSRSAIDICDDKLAFHERITASGLSEFVPRVDSDLAPPYVLKGRWGHAGDHVHLVLDRNDEPALPPNSDPAHYFRQELIPGRYEYSVHILFISGRIRRALCIEHDMTRDMTVKGPLRPSRQRIVRCRELPLFARILTALEFEGLCNIDFKLRDGKPIVLEVNPRIGSSLCPYFFAFLRSLPRASPAALAMQRGAGR